MAIADFDEYLALLQQNRVADFQIAGNISTTRMGALYRILVPTPAVPTASVALDKSSAVSIGPIPNSSTGKLCILGGRLNTSSIAGLSLNIVDVLDHSGGLSGTVTTEQTTNLPTAALTRHTSGEGVMIGLVIYTLVGTTATTVAVRYTNQAGTANQVSTATTFGGTGFREVHRMILIPLAAGDTGVQSVEGVTLTATTGSAGNFGVVLFKPLTVFALDNTGGSMPIDAITGGMVGAMQSFDDDACLSLIGIYSIAQQISGAILLAEV